MQINNQVWPNTFQSSFTGILKIEDGQGNAEMEEVITNVHPNATFRESNPHYKNLEIIEKLQKFIPCYRMTNNGIEIEINQHD